MGGKQAPPVFCSFGGILLKRHFVLMMDLVLDSKHRHIIMVNVDLPNNIEIFSHHINLKAQIM
jgi:hypothetical protein